mmetsp:Transcript_5166/g.9237  ORF Transcript_5166/g.9237 Transcript_5166/m.9237 type:complete len:89 (+) Transcript_5166:90-356(+)
MGLNGVQCRGGFTAEKCMWLDCTRISRFAAHTPKPLSSVCARVLPTLQMRQINVYIELAYGSVVAVLCCRCFCVEACRPRRVLRAELG